MAAFTAWDHVAQQFEERRVKYATPGELARAIDPRTRQTPALELIDEALVRLADTPDGRLIISMPPQEGKSTRVAKDFPTWMLMQNPDCRIVTASYGQGLANRNGRVIRRNITDHPSLGLRIADDNGAVHEWQLAGHDGGVLSVGVGAGVTGRPADCISADMHIECEHGVITAAEAFRLGITRIRAYDHDSGQAVWRDVEAARRIPGRRVVTVITESGRSIVCTPDHRVYTGRGYVAARDLRHGDSLVALVGAHAVPLRSAARHAEDGSAESDSAQPESVLLAEMHGQGVRASEPDETLHRVRRADTAEPEDDMQPRLSPQEAGEVASGDRLPSVRPDLPTKVGPYGVLLQRLRERSALAAHDRQGQLALQDGYQLRELVSLDAPAGPDARRPGVRGLQESDDHDVRAQGEDGHQVGIGDSPHRRGLAKQYRGEPDHPVPQLSHEASQVEGDTVSLVRGGSEDQVDVYDFQVEDTRNFFADGVLVHNCLIIDDPLKDRKEAESALIRQNVWDWWTDSASTRLAPGAPVVVILTRWHQEDLAGMLLAQEDGHLWEVLNIPALADHDLEKGETDPLGREPGEFMQSARTNKDGRPRTAVQWLAIMKRAGSRAWNALYQGRPSAVEGDMFRREQWGSYRNPQWLDMPDGSKFLTGFDDLLISWDMAFKDTESSDFVVGQVWMRRGADIYLLDQVRDRMDFVETCARFRELAARWPQATLKLVEDKANGTAVINALRRIVQGIVPEEPQGSKVARASAVTPLVEARNVHLPAPELAPWIADFIEEAAAFPNGAHDDQVDAMSQALNRLILAPLSPNDTFEPEEFDDYDVRGYAISPI